MVFRIIASISDSTPATGMPLCFPISPIFRRGEDIIERIGVIDGREGILRVANTAGNV